MTLTQSDSSTRSESRSGELQVGSAEGAQSYDPRRWRALPVVLSATFMSLFDIFVVNVAAPSIQHDLHASSSILEMVVAGYSFSYAAGLVTGARLGDLVGRRRMFTIGLGLFAAASLIAHCCSPAIHDAERITPSGWPESTAPKSSRATVSFAAPSAVSRLEESTA